MQELGIGIDQVLECFPHEKESPYVLIRVAPEHANKWAEKLFEAVRRCYLSDEFLKKRADELEAEVQGTSESRQAEIINSKLPTAGPTMAGDFGEILTYVYQAAKTHPQVAFGPKKWRLKQDSTKPAPYSDVVHFILPAWPTPTAQDEILCAEVKTKSTKGAFAPIDDAIKDCAKDRISRLSSTLQWLKARAYGETLGAVQIAHLNRFINATDYPPALKRFHAVAIICSSLVEAELQSAPSQVSTDYKLIVIAIPDLKAIYTAVFDAARTSCLSESKPA
jgi:hypothetical protein